MTPEQVINIAAARPFAVHKYRWRDDRLRKMCHTLRRTGRLKLVAEDRDNRYYESTIKVDQT